MTKSNIKPITFSEEFGINSSVFAKEKIFDPTLNLDSNFALDPFLLGQSGNPIIRDAGQVFDKYFSDLLKLIAASVQEGDLAWNEAYKRLIFREVSGTCLGFGASSIRGSGWGPKLAYSVLKTARAIVELGVDTPEMFTAIPVFQEDLGPDRISDMVTNTIIRELIAFNQEIITRWKLPTKKYRVKTIFGLVDANLVQNPTQAESNKDFVLLVPTDVLRHMPIAASWSEIASVSAENEDYRSRVALHIGEIWQRRSNIKKKEIRNMVLKDAHSFTMFLDVLSRYDKSSYDFNLDPDGLQLWTKYVDAARQFPYEDLQKAESIEQAISCVNQIVEQFSKLVGKNGLWKEFWLPGNEKRRHENCVQRLFYAIADSYCRAYDLALSPEADAGVGPVDFKFSKGYDQTILVEVKLSDNPNLINGYIKQLNAYREAESTKHAVYVVCDVGHLGDKDEKLLKLYNDEISDGGTPSTIVFVNALPQKSASKRK